MLFSTPVYTTEKQASTVIIKISINVPANKNTIEIT